MSTRLFISTVTHEFLSCRMRLSEDLRFPDVVVENQEEYIAKLASGHSLLIKLDDYIKECHAVIHLLGQQTSKDGRVANADAVEDLLGRYSDFPAITALSAVELRSLSYTQWEAWLAYFHIKKSRPALKLIIATPDHGFSPDNPADAQTALRQKQSQAWHAQELRQRNRYSEISFASTEALSIQILRALKDILPPLQPTQRIAASRIINRHTVDDFIGRETKLEVLDAAWGARNTVNVQCVIAWGGVGKTALLARWVQTRFRDRGWKNEQGQADPIHYFDWTFYDQGTRAEDATQAGVASIGTFFVEALRHFGAPDPNLPERKAERLAALVQAHRSLLVLDGLEPLQYPHNHPQAGQITDPDLAQLLRILAQRNSGLCLVSSRVGLSELRGHLTSNAPHHELDDLSPEAAIALLRKLHVTGSDADLAQAAADYQRHALSLILLGQFLATARGGDIRQRDTVSFEKANDKRTAHTRSAWHVLEMYEAWLASPGGNPVDLQALRLIGLFDRPASPDCLEALRREPAITGLTDLLVPLDRDDWNAVLQRLHEAHLIQLKLPPRDPGSQTPYPEPRSVPVDAHPLVREYFAKQLRDKQPDGFAAAHSRLFDYLCQSTPHRPETLEGLQPLYQAVVHGCLAGRQQEACAAVYYKRIQRDTDDDSFFSTKRLGAYGDDLGAVAVLLKQPWRSVEQALDREYQSWLLNLAAHRLRSLGRLAEAVEPTRACLALYLEDENWVEAARNTGNLSELELELGELDAAIATARLAITYADRIDPPDLFQRSVRRAVLAYALHNRACSQLSLDSSADEARILFQEAERIEAERCPEWPLLPSLRGFNYCDLILAPTERAAWQQELTVTHRDLAAIDSALAEAQDRAEQVTERARRKANLLEIALDLLTQARVALYRTMLEPAIPAAPALHSATTALAAMRKANVAVFRLLALLTAATAHHLTGDNASALALFDEAQHIAERGPMPLYLADVHLHRARLVGILPPNQRADHWHGVDPKAELAKARALIEKHGYWRRREELADAEEAAKNW